MREAVHHHPIWREQADFIIAVAVDPSGTDVMTEQLWARRVGERTFELCCIPFFAYDVALGDVVETDGDYLVERVIRSSGRYVFRVHFPPSSLALRSVVVSELTGLGAQLEWSSHSMVAVDAPDFSYATDIADYLYDKQRDELLEYETGRT